MTSLTSAAKNCRITTSPMAVCLSKITNTQQSTLKEACSSSATWVENAASVLPFPCWGNERANCRENYQFKPIGNTTVQDSSAASASPVHCLTRNTVTLRTFWNMQMLLMSLRNPWCPMWSNPSRVAGSSIEDILRWTSCLNFACLLSSFAKRYSKFKPIASSLITKVLFRTNPLKCSIKIDNDVSMKMMPRLFYCVFPSLDIWKYNIVSRRFLWRKSRIFYTILLLGIANIISTIKDTKSWWIIMLKAV